MTKAKPLPDQDTLKRLLDYDESTGALIWKARTQDVFTSTSQAAACARWNTKFANKHAFTATDGKYRVGKVFGVSFAAHRVIWKWMTGEDPDEVDHIDGDGFNNAWRNLRNVDRHTNSMNAARPNRKPKSLDLPVGVSKQGNRYHVEVAGKKLGTFKTAYEARAAAKVAYKILGFHPNHGRPPKNHKP